MENKENKKNDLEKTEEFSLPEYPISFAIFALARSHRMLAAQLIRDIGLFPGQEIMLMQLLQKDGQSQNSLGKTMRLDHSTVAKSVKRLEEAGFVTRIHSQVDKRVTIVSLTEYGHNIALKVIGAWGKLETLTAQVLTEEEKALFVKLSGQIGSKVDNLLHFSEKK